jgi:hypothetical protein
MLGPVDYCVWFLSFGLEIFVVVCSLARRDFLRYLALNLAMLGAAMANMGDYYFMLHYGLHSLVYRYFYYYSECVLIVLLYFSLFDLFQHVFAELGATKYIRATALLLLLGTAGVSFLMVRQIQAHLIGRFVIELSQNLYFVGLVLSYVLWGAMMKLRETRTRLIQLALSLGVFFSAYSATYALRNLFPGLEIAQRILPPLLSLWLPVTWSFTLWKIPEEARLETARLAATPAR